jgi:hypothetical protein
MPSRSSGLLSSPVDFRYRLTRVHFDQPRLLPRDRSLLEQALIWGGWFVGLVWGDFQARSTDSGEEFAARSLCAANPLR